MVRVPRLAPVALVALLSAGVLAGCSGPSQDTASPASAAPVPQVTTVVGQRQAPAFTDTIHFLAPPTYTTRAPATVKPVRDPIPAFTNGPSSTPTWDVVLKEDTQALHGEAVLYGEVNGTVLNDPVPTAGGCFWEFSVYWDSLDPRDYPYLPCGVEPSVVPAGIREVVVPIDLTGPWPAGTVLHFRFYTQDFARAPNAQVDFLTGSVDQDSRMTLAGLQLPLDASLLLSTS